MELVADRVIATRYRLVRPLGEGGMGAVWSAHDERDSREVALKFAKEADVRVERRRRFAREARAAMKIAHRNVVRIYEVVTPEDAAAAGVPPFMVMDRLVGESLASRIARGPIELTEFADLFVQVLSAVGTAHAMGIVHRDLKPANIFLASVGSATEVRVLDFGIAKFAEEDVATASTNLTGTGEMIGTPHYMSPEQIFGERDIDYRTDLWSLGVIAHECLAGRSPIVGDNIGQIFKAITAARIPSLGAAAPHVPGAIQDVVDRLVARDRNKRPADLRAVLEVFRTYASIDVPSFDAPSASFRVADEAPVLLRETVDDAPPLARSRSRWPSVLAVLVAVAGAAIAVSVLRAPPPPAASTVAAPLTVPSPAVTPAISVPEAPAVEPSKPVPVASSAPIPSAVLSKPRVTPDAGAMKKVPHDEDI